MYDYLFDQRNHVKEEEATMLIALLMDLQEDFRYAVKRAFIKYILKYELYKIISKQITNILYCQFTIRESTVAAGKRTSRISDAHNSWTSSVEMQLPVGY